jgi:phosphohistidine swiveling domain-containing protein
VRLRGVGASSTYGGSLAATSALCASLGPTASVVFVNASTAADFAPTVRVLCGVPTASMAAGSSSASVEAVVTSIERDGRRPVLLGSSRAAVSLLGAAPRAVVSLRTTVDAEVLTGPPATNWPATYTVWMSSPSA